MVLQQKPCSSFASHLEAWPPVRRYDGTGNSWPSARRTQAGPRRACAHSHGAGPGLGLQPWGLLDLEHRWVGVGGFLAYLTPSRATITASLLAVFGLFWVKKNRGFENISKTVGNQRKSLGTHNEAPGTLCRPGVGRQGQLDAWPWTPGPKHSPFWPCLSIFGQKIELFKPSF